MYILVITVKWDLYKGLQINIISTLINSVIHNQSTMYKFLYVMVSDNLDGQKKLNFQILTSTVSWPVEVKKKWKGKKNTRLIKVCSLINTHQLTISRYVHHYSSSQHYMHNLNSYSVWILVHIQPLVPS